MNYDITNLFDKVKEKVLLLNSQLEENKLSFIERQYDEKTTLRNLKIMFNDKAIVFTFSNYDLIDRFDENEKEKAVNFQKQKYGMVMRLSNDSYLKANKFILIGLAETEDKIGDIEYGFNLLLKKDENSDYGEWYMLQIAENCHPPKTKFGINLNSFCKEIDKFRLHPCFTTTIRELKDDDIISLLRMLMIM